MGPHLEGPSRGPGGGADLVPGPRAAQEGGLAGHGLPLQGVQDPILLKLGNVLQGVPGAVAGGSRECLLAEAVALGVRGPQPGPALSLPAGPETPRGVTVACTCVQPLCDPPSLPITQGQDGGGLLPSPPRGPGRCLPALTPRIGSATPGWWGPGGTAAASRAPGSAGALGPDAAVPPPGQTSPVWLCAGHPR